MTGTPLSTRQIGLILFGALMLIGSECAAGNGDGSGIESVAAPTSACASFPCPVARSGRNQTLLVGTVATLNGSQSFSKTAGLITYLWTLDTKPTGSAATLAGETTVYPTFTPDLEGDYNLTLVVSSDGSASVPSSVTVTAGIGDLAPIAYAGRDRTAPPNSAIMLNGAGSYDPNGGALTHQWDIIAQEPGSLATLDNPTSATPSFTADTVGTYTVRLKTNDGVLTSAEDLVVITVATGNIRPVAHAGLKQHVSTGHLVTLTGGGSTDANTDPLTYSWRFESMPVGSEATLAGATTVGPTFTPDFAGFYVLSLRVNDGTVDSRRAMVVIKATRSGSVNRVFQAYVKGSNTEVNDSFGTSVALSGDTLAVGAYAEDSCATGIGGDQADNGCSASGAVYVFTRQAGVWSQQAYVKASNTGGIDSFGQSVALSGDTLAVGAYRENSCATGIGGDQTDNNCEFSGAVYVFTRQAGVWSQQAYVKASNAKTGDNFGTSVALSGDTLAVGAEDERSSGAVYVFTRQARVWSQQAYVKASNASTGLFDRFGTSVALSGDTLAVGAEDERSCATGIGGDQADNGCRYSGAVYVFTRQAGVWSQQAYVKASNTEARASHTKTGDNFGTSVALSGDTLAVGAYGEDSCATGIGGDQADNGCLDSGAVYVFTRQAGVWSQQAYVKASNTEARASNTVARDRFGKSVALSGDTLAVGAYGEDSCATGIGGDQADNGCRDSGAVYVFTPAAGQWSQQDYVKAVKDSTSDPGLPYRFGRSVALRGDTLAVGAPSEDHLTGAVYVYVEQ